MLYHVSLLFDWTLKIALYLEWTWSPNQSFVKILLLKYWSVSIIHNSLHRHFLRILQIILKTALQNTYLHRFFLIKISIDGTQSQRYRLRLTDSFLTNKIIQINKTLYYFKIDRVVISARNELNWLLSIVFFKCNIVKRQIES